MSNDQADSLRDMMSEHKPPAALPPVAVFTGAVPGVGKSLLVAALAGALTRSGLRVVSASSIEQVASANRDADLALIDGTSGLRPGFHLVLVITPQLEVIEESVRWAAVLRREVGMRNVNLVVNRVTDGAHARRAFERLKGFMPRFWDVKVDYLGHFEENEKFARAVAAGKNLVELNPEAALELLAKRLKHKCLGATVTGRSNLPLEGGA